MSTMSKGGTGEELIESNDINNLNLVYKFIKNSKEESDKFNENSYDDYIKVKEDIYTLMILTLHRNWNLKRRN